ncbi:FMN-binding negative transcriptional regulator [Pseudomonas sp. P66]|jgi:transcriptional regulator|uniref:FMN-binding negative transcriptional regulator n=1 Tax=Pseudomonas arcuscaelestis TaxID=2710591 RepID=A0ABS2BTS6_9PSED|nr:FMN-binding negative transcriptional regulator [Pseudomonas arcuscaelestis]MBM3110058.1 FMN-binding negative transcriptional regulator [Pseudomonas arcuscaelestis]MBM5456214.1 FMN-binding negative transcriptional regulator [Pseudomonas arcuscaelestis]
MFTPSSYQETDLSQLQQQIEQTRLAVLVTHGEQGLQASHLPLLLDRSEGRNGTLYGHFSRANRQWQELADGAEALVVFAGPDAYVSAGYYPSKLEDPRTVPTWNYQAVHAWGKAEVFHDAERLLDIVRRLSDHHEQRQAKPWSVDEAPSDYMAGMLKAIVGFALPIDRLQGTRKLSQNRSAVDIEGVRSALANSPDPMDNQLAALMRQP